MQRELELLHSRVFKTKRRMRRLMAVLVCSVAGSGKSHLVRQYVWMHLHDYPGGIFWVDAKSFQSTCKCFWDIAVGVGLVDRKTSVGGRADQGEEDDTSNLEYIDAVRNWFQSREDWLLVFDGVSFDEDQDISHFKQFLPTNKNCSIIYTSVDKTLARKQRLFEPYCLTVLPLNRKDGCRLLFKDLAIRKPSQSQIQKAEELVGHYEGLPLALHAIGHRLSASGKPIEKYRIHSHFTDQKLAEPFLGIMNDLYRMGHFEALSLINLLSFFGHHIPVGLVALGQSALEQWDAQVLTSSQPGESPDLDTTLRMLMKYGLVERSAAPYELWYPRDDQKRQHEVENRNSNSSALTRKIATVDSSESTTESSASQNEGVSTIPRSASSIDMIKVHSVVQTFCRDELLIIDKEARELGIPEAANYYDSWLVVATLVFCKAYERAKSKTELSPDVGLVRDYRELSTQGSRLLSFYSRKARSVKPSSSVHRQARGQLKEIMSSVESQITTLSRRTLSQDELNGTKSIFERYSSPSSSIQDSTDETGPSHRSTSSDEEDSSRTVWHEADLFDHHTAHLSLRPFPPHNYRATPYDDVGYESDVEETKTPVAVHSPPSLLPARPRVNDQRPGFPQASISPNDVDIMEWKVMLLDPNPAAKGPAGKTCRLPVGWLGKSVLLPTVLTTTAHRAREWGKGTAAARDALMRIRGLSSMVASSGNNVGSSGALSGVNMSADSIRTAGMEARHIDGRESSASSRQSSSSRRPLGLQARGIDMRTSSNDIPWSVGRGRETDRMGRGRELADSESVLHRMHQLAIRPASRGRSYQRPSSSMSRSSTPRQTSPAGFLSVGSSTPQPTPISGQAEHPSAVLPGSSSPSVGTGNNLSSSQLLDAAAGTSSPEPLLREPTWQSQALATAEEPVAASAPLSATASLGQVQSKEKETQDQEQKLLSSAKFQASSPNLSGNKRWRRFPFFS